MKLADKMKLAAKMYPAALDNNPDYEWDREGNPNQPPMLGELASDICDDLVDFAGCSNEIPIDPCSISALSHGAKHIIVALQEELRLAKNMIALLKSDVDYAEEVFVDQCECGKCHPCQRAKRFNSHTKKALVAIERITLTQ